MKNIHISFLLLFLGISANAQSNYSKGFQEGWKAGYCYQSVTCLPPITPITPVRKNGESDTYTDGYNRGFQMGLDRKRSTPQQGTLPSSGGGTSATGVTSAPSVNYGSFSQQGLQNFANARMREWANMRYRRLIKYKRSPSKKTTVKLYRANKVLGLPPNSDISSIHYSTYILKYVP